MVFFLSTQIKQEVFPEFTIDIVSISVAYHSASPSEVESGIILPVEEAIQNIDGIKKISSTANEGSGNIIVEIVEGENIQKIYEDIKSEIERISSFPEDAEDPVVVIPSNKRNVLTMMIYGDLDRKHLRNIAEDIKEKLTQDKEVTQIEFKGDKPFEISVEISQEKLKEYNISIQQIAQKIKTATLDLPGGSIKSKSGEILIRMKERKDYGFEIAKIPILTNINGTIVKLGDIANIKDNFKDTDIIFTFNGKPAIGLDVFRIGNQTPITVSNAVHKHLKKFQASYPKNVGFCIPRDSSKIFRQRINLLLKNGTIGLILVFCLLGLFLEPKLAFWVTMGIPISFLGSILIITKFGLSINMISLFAFIISLGIVVDDAIIVGENIYTYRQKGYSFFEASVKGAKDISIPVIFSVITNMVAFMPLYFVPGIMGKFFKNIPVVVLSVFAISLIESLLILPAHLAHSKKKSNGKILSFIHSKQNNFSKKFTNFINNIYTPFLKISLKYRYVSIAIAISILIISLAYVKCGRMGFVLFPIVESDYAYAKITMPYGVSVETSEKIEKQLLNAANKIVKEVELKGKKQTKGISSFINKNTISIKVFMTEPEVRPISSKDFNLRWKKKTGNLVGIESSRFFSDHGGPGSGASLTIDLQHKDNEILKQASVELAKSLKTFPIASDIDDGFMPGKKQFDFTLKKQAYFLGLTPNEIARQIRNSYYGLNVLKQLRGRNEVEIFVRFPKNERISEYNLEEMLIKTPQNIEVPLRDIVNIKKGRAYTSIKRNNGSRIVTVSCNVTPQKKTEMLVASLKENILPKLKEKYSGLNYSFEGKQANIRESLSSLKTNMILALILIYILLAIPFKSYIQPTIIMISIPFGIIGAIIGHILMGYSLSILSMFGIVALSGVVVNDSLVLIDYANKKIRNENINPFPAIIQAATARFRPILLTTFTTFFGLMPMVFETSMQARFLIPMAISLSFGILFSTLIILVLVPALYIALEDIKKIAQKVRNLITL